MDERRSIPPNVRRERRHSAHVASTAGAFLHGLSAVLGLPEAQARRALRAVLCGLSHRITAEELDDLCAQLPTALKALARLCPSGKHAAPARSPRRIHYQQFMAMVDEDLGSFPLAPDRTVARVFRFLREHVTQGEIDQIAAQLPRDLKDFVWGESVHP